jgi:hypothetical protein
MTSNIAVVRFLISWFSKGLHSLNEKMSNEYGAVGGMRIGRGNGTTLRKTAPVPLYHKCHMKRACTGPAFRMVTSTSYGVSWVVEYISFPTADGLAYSEYYT